MFKPTEGNEPEVFNREAALAEKNYTIKKNDLLELEVFSNKGEKLIDPNPELTIENQSVNNEQKKSNNYLVGLNGIAKFPVIGDLMIDGLSLRQAEEIAQKEYSKYFKEPFVILSFVNKRVVVLGAAGGQVIPLTNQNVTLLEVIALAKGINNDARANPIKLIRNNSVYQFDYSTIEGFKKGNILVEPGDIIYIEPIRRPFTEAAKDTYFLFSMFLSLVTVVVLIKSL
jgi:polysaccharide export outer membrane protein